MENPSDSCGLLLASGLVWQTIPSTLYILMVSALKTTFWCNTRRSQKRLSVAKLFSIKKIL